MPRNSGRSVCGVVHTQFEIPKLAVFWHLVCVAVEAADAKIRPRGGGGRGFAGSSQRQRRPERGRGSRRGREGRGRRARAAPASHLAGAPRHRPIDSILIQCIIVLAGIAPMRARCRPASFVDETRFMFWMIIYFRRGPARAEAPRQATAKTVVVHYTGGPPAAPTSRGDLKYFILVIFEKLDLFLY